MRLNKNLIAVLVILLMFATLISNIWISNTISKKYPSPTGKAPSTSGVVNLTIESVSGPSEGQAQTTGGGGGGGGALPKIFILDFRVQDSYGVKAQRLDTIITIFTSDKNYSFEVGVINTTSAILKLKGKEILIDKDYITYIDFDQDKFDDLSIAYDGNELVFVILRKIQITTEEIEPIITYKKILGGEPIQKPSIIEGRNYLFLLILLLALITALILYGYSRKLRKIEKRKPISKIEIKTEEKSSDLVKRKLDVLDRSYKEGYITKDSYLKSSQRIKELLKR